MTDENLDDLLARNRQMMLDALECPEDYLWIRYRDRSGGTILDRYRLYELMLKEGAEPKDETEQLLAANPEWLRIYLRHVIGECPITIPEGGPLTKWSETWLGVWEDEERLEAGLEIFNDIG